MSHFDGCLCYQCSRPVGPTAESVLEAGWAGFCKTARVPLRYHAAENVALPEIAEPVIDSKVTDCALVGPLGSGKTWIATRLLWECVKACAEREQLLDPFWMDSSDLADSIRSEWKSDYAGQTLRYCCNVDALMLDDLGAEASYSWAKDEVSLLLRTRYNHCRLTIVTCQTLNEIEGRIASRLRGGVVIRLDGKDRRQI